MSAKVAQAAFIAGMTSCRRWAEWAAIHAAQATERIIQPSPSAS